MENKYNGECKKLADILAEKRANGLVDIKFLVSTTENDALEDVCEELVSFYAAIEAGACKPLRFNDSHRPKAA